MFFSGRFEWNAPDVSHRSGNKIRLSTWTQLVNHAIHCSTKIEGTTSFIVIKDWTTSVQTSRPRRGDSFIRLFPFKPEEKDDRCGHDHGNAKEVDPAHKRPGHLFN